MFDHGPQYSASQAVAELTASGVADAQEAVQRYLNDTSADSGLPVHTWALDDGDLDRIERAVAR